jgi:hypothetical protein
MEGQTASIVSGMPFFRAQRPSIAYGPGRSEFRVRNHGVGINQNHLGIFGKNAKHGGNFVWKPYVILVTKDDITGR